VKKKAVAIVIVAVLGAGAALWAGYPSPVGMKLGRWYFAATPVDIIEQEMQNNRDRTRPLELDLVFVDRSVVAGRSAEVRRLYTRIRDSLMDDGDRLVDPSGCIRLYSHGDLTAVTLEYYLDCDCEMKTSMDVLYLSVDLSGFEAGIGDEVRRSGMPRIGYPEIDPVYPGEANHERPYADR